MFISVITVPVASVRCYPHLAAAQSTANRKGPHPMELFPTFSDLQMQVN